MTDALIPVIGIVAVAAITPGPNNFIVMAAAARGGPLAAVPAAAGVVVGSLCLLVIVWAGAGAAFQAIPSLRPVLTLAGASYLCWLGVCLIRDARGLASVRGAPAERRLPASGFAVAAFQLLNPKAWVLVLTASAAMGREPAAVYILAAIFAVITIPCLSLWAVAGSAIAVALRRPAAKAWFDRSMGALLVCSAILIALRT